MSSVPAITLNNGTEIPQLGFGVFQISPEKTKEAVLSAFDVGYRHIDTAEMYGNEKQVGEALVASGLNRDDVFLTSKLNNGSHDPDDAVKAFNRSLEDLNVEQIDLFLIHWPLPKIGDFVQTWEAMEEFYRSGRARSVGVSNFEPHHLRRLLAETTVVPVVNQIEVHPYLTQDNVRTFGREQHIATEAWSPLAQGKVLDNPTIVKIAEMYGKTPARVTLRWHLQRGDIVFPKSVTRSRVEENFDVFDFELSAADLTAISALNRNERTGFDPNTFNPLP